MPLRCRPGDLAVVIWGSATGTFVDVLHRGPNHPHYRSLPSWECKVRTGCEVSLVDMETGRVLMVHRVPAGHHALFTDNSLQPIRPPPIPKALPAPPAELELTP